MFKTLFVAAMLVATPVFAAKHVPSPPSPADKSEVASPVKVITIPQKVVCMPVELFSDVIESNHLNVLTVSEVDEHGIRMVILFSPPEKHLVIANIIEEAKTACIMNEVKGIEFTEEGITNMFGRKA